MREQRTSSSSSRDGDSVAKETVLLQIISFSVVCDLSTWPEMKSKQQPAAAAAAEGKQQWQQQCQQHTNKFA